MDEKQPRKTVREEFAEQFISILESEQPLSWTKGWATSGYKLPCNGGTGRHYNGINRLILAFASMEQGWTDNRFYTFNQVTKMEGCKVEAGSKATRVEYWAVYDTKEKKTLTLSQYQKLRRENPDRQENEFRLFSKSAYVFNAAQIEGLAPLPPVGEKAWDGTTLAEEVVKTMSENMEVELHYGGDQAYYRPDNDSIYLPPKEAFYSSEDYAATALHELAHATGAPSRLNRPLDGLSQNRESYAIEELRAEISSTFVCGELGVEMPDSVIENHKAYVQSWLSAIKKDHSVLFSAIRDADKITDYMLEKGRVEELQAKLEAAAQMPKKLSGISYEIWQLRDVPENDILRFASYDTAIKFRLTESRYDKVYEAQAGEDDDTLDKLYYKFNVNHPADFKGHSMSMSDIVVLNIHGKRTAWYCDTFGFKEVEDFCQTRKNAEVRGKCR